MQCTYLTQRDCQDALRAKQRQHYRTNGCFLSTADPTWWHYGYWVLEYWP